ncbi:MAG TPA: biopolymer transporter ExbD [Firmicutes bacterium]|nr:biopolymer transporter ExbD [Bacillota bacterium]
MKVKKKTKPTPDISSASMSDIAFLLIIFFMLTTVFSQEQGLNYRIPETVKPVTEEMRNIEILVQENGTLIFQGKNIPYEQIRDIAIARKAANPEIFAVLKVEEKTPYGYIVNAMDELLVGGIENIAFVSAELNLEDAVRTP